MLHNNYSNQAIQGLEENNKNLLVKGFHNSILINKLLIKLLKQAKKFVLPEGGRLRAKETFESEMVPLFKLPYDVMVFEYYAPQIENFVLGEDVASKRIALAFDSKYMKDIAGLLTYDQDSFEEGVIVWPISYYDDIKCWMPCWAGVLLPTPLRIDTYMPDLSPEFLTKVQSIGSDDAIVVKRLMHGEIGMNVLIESVKRKANMVELFVIDTSDEMSGVVSAVCAMNCQNVKTSLAQTAPRKASDKTKVKHLFEYHYLTLEPYKEQLISGSKGGTHASPVSHLRMGHFRHFKNGTSVWINAVQVNKDKDFVDKGYTLR